MANVEIARYGKKFVQYFWDPMPTNENDSAPIWCLGRRYESSMAPSLPPSSVSRTSEVPSEETSWDEAAPTEAKAEDGGWPVAFLDDFEARFWFTYRSNFPAIARSQDPKAASALSFAVRLRSQLAQADGFTSDTGWGCMIRSGQSLLANTLQILRCGRDFKPETHPKEQREIVSLFADDPRAPFSIHKFVEYGASACGKHPGEWFGPSATARCIQELVKQYDTGLRVYIRDGTEVYEDSFLKAAMTKSGEFQPTLVLMGVRLGIDRITPVYWEALKVALQMPQSIGIAGGRPSSSHYFVGTQASWFFYLDPHFTRPALPLHTNVDEYTEDELASCHTRRLRRIHIEEMDPSMLIGFLMRDKDDWTAWKKAISAVPGKAIIHVADKEPSLTGTGYEREGAIDEVETFDTEDDDAEL
ncbi:hypothetical protein EJ06DRAFT_543324 [Trichodelitschia bisporula]|uniref:Cysteine protease n=1 Tax=Trichodelitschia bisporula TaxID=703511 RepID=A0A6G1HUU5_9PEZI|nr:hypothetical protein EJ06DRAFT_543324 [Trichodelitschia bisporula]